MSQFTRPLVNASRTLRIARSQPISNTLRQRSFQTSTAKMVVHNITSAAQWDEETKSGLVVVDCFATWCGPCKMIAPALVKFSEEYTSAKFIKLDVDDFPEIAAANKVSAMPTFLFYKDGAPVSAADIPDIKDSRIIGADPRKLKAAIDALTATTKA